MNNSLPHAYASFQKFCEENPLKFNEEELARIKSDIMEPRKGVVSDEFVDFLLWNEGLETRQESFADFVAEKLPVSKYPKLLEVGCGRTARLAKRLAKRGYEMTAMDPKAECAVIESEGMNCIAEYFDWQKTDLSEYDAVVAQEPCEATEHIVRACMKQGKSFVVALCGVPHTLLNGEEPQDTYAWYQYLQEIGEGKCTLTALKLVKGYTSYVIFAMQ